jgi:hypothetical protein
LVAFASASRARACAVVSRARAASSSRSAPTRALRLGDAAAGAADVADRRGRRDRHGALRGQGASFGVRELRARLVDRHLVIARIELDEDVPGFDELVVVDGDARDGAADARRDLRDARIQLRIVGRLAAGGEVEPAAAGGDDEDEDAGADAELTAADERPVGAISGCPHVLTRDLLGHPSARTRLPAARFDVKTAPMY